MSESSERPAGEVTRLLGQWSDGDEEALRRAIPLVYKNLEQIARGCLRNERYANTLRTGGLINEAYIRFAGWGSRPAWVSRAQFFRIATRMMRNTLVDHARKRKPSLLAEELPAELPNPLEPLPIESILTLDHALQELRKVNPKLHDVVEMRYFLGLSEQEVAELLGLSVRAVEERWKLARKWLQHRLAAKSS